MVHGGWMQDWTLGVHGYAATHGFLSIFAMKSGGRWAGLAAWAGAIAGPNAATADVGLHRNIGISHIIHLPKKNDWKAPKRNIARKLLFRVGAHEGLNLNGKMEPRMDANLREFSMSWNHLMANPSGERHCRHSAFIFNSIFVSIRVHSRFLG